ncbi:MAG: hypothetical protein AAFV49_22945 [Pseudomonadota bacterium]
MTLLKNAVLQAAVEAGGRESLFAYSRQQAVDNPNPLLALLGKVTLMQLETSVTRAEIVHWPLTNGKWAERHAVTEDAG